MKDLAQAAIAVMFFILLAAWLTFLHGCGCKQNYYYRMPDGTKCSYYRQGLGENKFLGCTNGKTYINPEFYGTESECAK